jgi:hypothetical protein
MDGKTRNCRVSDRQRTESRANLSLAAGTERKGEITMRRGPTLSVLLTVLLAAGVSVAGECDDDDVVGIIEDAEFIAPTLTGAAERPDPVTSTGSGRAFFIIDQDAGEGQFRVEVANLQDVTLAHIHIGDVNTAGPVAVELFNASGSPVDFTDLDVLNEGTFTEADIDDDSGVTTIDELVAAIEAGNAYVNVHTTANPPGEIRGQIEVAD